MHWLILVISGLFEAVWATALGKSEGLTRLTPSLVFVVGLVLSMLGLAYAMHAGSCLRNAGAIYRHRLCSVGGNWGHSNCSLRYGNGD